MTIDEASVHVAHVPVSQSRMVRMRNLSLQVRNVV